MMDEREELKQELKSELQWVKYRIRMLDIIEEKLVKMKRLEEQSKQDNLTVGEIETLNSRLKDLEKQVIALDGESR